MNSNSALFRWSFLGCMLIALCLITGTSTSFASTVNSPGDRCWSISPHCPDEIPNYEECPWNYPNYCPWDWSYEVVDSVSASSSSMTLSTSVGAPAFGPYGTTAYFTAEEFGAYDDSFFRVWLNIYNYQTDTWGGWNLWKSGWDLGTFDWWDTLGNPTLFAMYVDVRANYVNNWDKQSSVYYFAVADSVTSLYFNTTPASPVTAGQQVTLYAQGYGAPLGDYLYRFNVGTFTDGIFTGEQVLQNPSATSTCTWTVPPYDASKDYMLSVEASTNSKAQAYGFSFDQVEYSPGYYVNPPVLSINTSSFPEAMDGKPYSTNPLEADGGQPPYTWLNINSGQPTTYVFPGLSIDTNTGIISGIPNGWNENFTLTIQVTDSLNSKKTKDIPFVVHPRPYIQNASLPNGSVGTVYNNNQSLTLIASGGNHTYTWSANNLPGWLTFNTSTHTISVNGTPQAAGTYSFTINAISMGETATKSFTVIIYDQLRDTSVMGTSPKFGVPYNFQLSASGGEAPYYWTITSGNLPTVLTLNQSTGLISGTPTALGNYSWTITTSDSQSPAATVATGWNFTVAYDPVTITAAATLSPGNSGVNYSKFITVTGGDGTYSWSMTGGSLPAGINLNTSTGELYGTPTTGGDYSFTITVNDGVYPTASQAFTLKINSLPTITTTSINNGQYGVAYSQGLAASGGSGGYTWSLPVAQVGLDIDANSGIISGIPFDVGQFSVTVQTADAQNPLAFAAKTFTFSIFNGTMQQCVENPVGVGTEASPKVCVGSTGNVISGVVDHDQELFATKGGMQNIAISLFYKSLPAYNGSLGIGWSHSYDISLTLNADGSIVLKKGNGDKKYYTKNGSVYVSPPGDFSTLEVSGSGYVIRYRDGSTYNFNSTGKITSIADRFGNALTFDYTGGNLTITDSAYRTATIVYDQATTPPRITTITDPASNVYNFSYQGSNLYRVTNPAATTGAERGYWEYEYHPNGLLKSKRDPNGHKSQYTYYADKRMQTAIDPEGISNPTGHTRTVTYPTTTDIIRTSTLTEKDGNPWYYTYDALAGVIKYKTDPNGKIINYYYYPNGFIKAKTEPKDGAVRLTTFFTYDSYGNVLIETEPADISTTDPENVTDPTTLGLKVARHYTYDNDNFDRITGIADERGATTLTTSFAYSTDNGGEVATATTTPGNYVAVTKKYPNGTVKEIIDANQKSTTFTYFPNTQTNSDAGIVGLLNTATDPADITTTILSYDNNGNPLTFKVTDINNVDLPVNTTMDYDTLSRLTTTTKTSGRTTPAFSAIITQSGYDKMGNLTSFMDAEQSVDAQGVLIPLADSVLKKTKYEYNYNRQTTKITDANLNDTVFRYSGSGGTGVDKLIGVYDANVAKMIPLESQPHTAYIYDQSGRVERETDPLGKITRYTYYDSGQVKEKIDASATPEKTLITYEYNNRGQITKRRFSDNSEENFTYTANGQLETAGNQHIHYTYAYYYDGRLHTVTDNTNNRVINYDEYDAIGQRKQVTILKDAGADERIIAYNYDSANRPWQIISNAGTFQYDYDNLGRRGTLTYPNTNPITATYGYDDLNRLTGITHQAVGGPVIASVAYTEFDKVGNRKARTGATSETFGYDELYRLLSVTSPKPEAFTFDAVGNRRTGPSVADTAYQHNAANQMTQGLRFGYGYDNAGNQNSKIVPGEPAKSQTLHWDDANRLTSVVKTSGTEIRTVSFKYDPFGRRIEKTFVETVDVDGIPTTETETTKYLYDNEDIVLELFTTASGTEKTYFTHGHGIDEPLALERSGQFYFYHQDGLGSVTHITDASKAVVQSYEYEAYGLPTASTDFRNSYHFQGREYDWETGLIYYRGRYGDPIDGNFVSKDPIGMAGGLNLYQFVQGNPVNLTDPSGLMPPLIAAGLYYGGAKLAALGMAWTGFKVATTTMSKSGAASKAQSCTAQSAANFGLKKAAAINAAGAPVAFAPGAAVMAANSAYAPIMVWAGTGAGHGARTGYGQDILNEIPNAIEALLPGPPPMSPSGYVLGSYELLDTLFGGGND